MKAISILFVLLALMTAVGIAAQPAYAVGFLQASGHGVEPAWMLLCGATLLAVASAVRRYTPVRRSTGTK